jgi:hypothetical protein
MKQYIEHKLNEIYVEKLATEARISTKLRTPSTIYT